MTIETVGRLHEQEANSAIAEWLNGIGRGWRADAERAGALAGKRDRPDIIVRQGDRMPVIVELEYSRPAVSDAKRRLGSTLIGQTRPFTEVVAVGIAGYCREDSRPEFHRRLDHNERIFTVQLVSNARDRAVWPDNPMPATPFDLAAYCEYAQVSQAVIDYESARIADQISSAGKALRESIALTENRRHKTFARLREVVGGYDDEEAARTACAIWMIAIDLQNDLAAHSRALQESGLLNSYELREGADGPMRRDDLLSAWQIMKGVNYLPVMDLAIESLRAGDMGHGLADVLALLERISETLNGLHAKHIYNFAGELWQRLTPNREELAQHYTKPEIAELLATLSVHRFADRSAMEIGELNLMDAACGTGTLIGAGERALRRLYSEKGGRNRELHRRRMEEHVFALDVNGIAGTLTAKRLTDMDVAQDYRKSKVAVVTHPAGSLSLLDPRITGITDYLGYGGVAATPGLNNELGLFHVPHGRIDWALMNPPYSRARKGRVQIASGLDRLRGLARKAGWKMSHGQAGLASDFGNLCNMRLAPNGIFAHVLPLTAAHGGSWKSWREELEKDFQDIVVIANTSRDDLESMSADTAMGEMLVVAAKKGRRPQCWAPTEILCVNLHTAPATLAEGYSIAQEIASIQPDSKQGRLNFGNYVRVEQTQEGFPWGAVGNRNSELSAVGVSLLRGEAYDPLTLTAHRLSLPMGTLGDLASAGPTHHLIGYPKDGDQIGAFRWSSLADWPDPPAQQSLWAADSKTQTTILCRPTHGGEIVDRSAAERMVKRRGSWFISRNMRWTSQTIAAARTTQPSHGGRAWNALQNVSDEIGQCLALFYNSTWGGVARASYGQTTQAGRATVQVGAIAGLPCPAFGEQSQSARRARGIASERFEALSRLPLQPFAYCFRDANRHAIDSVMAEMLGLDPTDEAVESMLAYQRLLFAREPGVNGRQKSILKAIADYGSTA